MLVESENGQMLWDASVVDVSEKDAMLVGCNVIDAYKVQYKKKEQFVC